MPKANRGPDVWGDLERQIMREGDNPPYRFVGQRTAGRVDAATLARIIAEQRAVAPSVIEGESTVVFAIRRRSEDESSALLRRLMAKEPAMEDGECLTPPDAKAVGPDAVDVRAIITEAVHLALDIPDEKDIREHATEVLIDATMYRLQRAGLRWR